MFNKNSRDLFGIEKLLYDIFHVKSYNKFVRPTDNVTGLTHVQTQLKLLQIDLVISRLELNLKINFLEILPFHRMRNTRN